jgi:hypothetical protein
MKVVVVPLIVDCTRLLSGPHPSPLPMGEGEERKGAGDLKRKTQLETLRSVFGGVGRTSPSRGRTWLAAVRFIFLTLARRQTM